MASKKRKNLESVNVRELYSYKKFVDFIENVELNEKLTNKLIAVAKTKNINKINITLKNLIKTGIPKKVPHIKFILEVLKTNIDFIKPYLNNYQKRKLSTYLEELNLVELDRNKIIKIIYCVWQFNEEYWFRLLNNEMELHLKAAFESAKNVQEKRIIKNIHKELNSKYEILFKEYREVSDDSEYWHEQSILKKIKYFELIPFYKKVNEYHGKGFSKKKSIEIVYIEFKNTDVINQLKQNKLRKNKNLTQSQLDYKIIDYLRTLYYDINKL